MIVHKQPSTHVLDGVRMYFLYACILALASGIVSEVRSLGSLIFLVVAITIFFLTLIIDHLFIMSDAEFSIRMFTALSSALASVFFFTSPEWNYAAIFGILATLCAGATSLIKHYENTKI